MRTLLLVLCLGLVAPGCIDDSASSANVTGQVLNQKFQSYSGVADNMGSFYAITLADSPLYGCSTTPDEAYLHVVVGAGMVGTFQAKGNVSFNATIPTISSSVEEADSGTVTITEIDTVNQIIRGEISATGATSQVSGDFDVKICP